MTNTTPICARFSRSNAAAIMKTLPRGVMNG